jgi:DNA-directed RNA polymerase specialized sigma24 family protein
MRCAFLISSPKVGRAASSHAPGISGVCMDMGARRWLYTEARISRWRVPQWMSVHDLIQDGYMCWYRVIRRYSRVPRGSSAHRMALFKRVFRNHVHDLSKQRSRLPEVHIEDLPPGMADLHAYDLQQVYGGAPPLVKLGLTVLMAPQHARSLRSHYRFRADMTRETFNERLCRLAGLDPRTIDLAGEIREYLTGCDSHTPPSV